MTRVEPRFSDGVSLSIVPTLLMQAREAADKLNAERPRVHESLRATDLASILVHYETVSLRLGHANQLADALFMTDATNDEVRTVLAAVERESTAIRESLLWFGLVLKRWPRQRLLMLADELPQYAQWFRELADHAKYILSEPEERIILLKDKTGPGSLDKLYSLITSKFRFKLTVHGKVLECSQEELRPFLFHEERDVRKAAMLALKEPYEAAKDELGEIYAALAEEHDVEAVTLRGYTRPIETRHQANNLPAAAYEALAASARKHQSLFRSYVERKQKLLGLQIFEQWDFNAPIGGLPAGLPYDAAREKVLAAFARFSPWMHEHAQAVFTAGRVDVYPRLGKRAGAFCVPMVPGEQAMMMLNHTETLDGLFTIAHELGHVVHETLAKKHSVLVFDPPIALAETASTFAEELLFHDLLSNADTKTRIALLCHSLDEAIRGIPTQLRYTRFEIAAHDALQQGAGVAALDQLWSDLLREDFPRTPWPQTSVMWRGIPHIYHYPFYCYGYSFGHLLVLCLYRRYQEEGAAFVPKYKAILEAGGSRMPADLLAEYGYDVTSEAFWDQGFTVLQERMAELDSLLHKH